MIAIYICKKHCLTTEDLLNLTEALNGVRVHKLDGEEYVIVYYNPDHYYPLEQSISESLDDDEYHKKQNQHDIANRILYERFTEWEI